MSADKADGLVVVVLDDGRPRHLKYTLRAVKEIGARIKEQGGEADALADPENIPWLLWLGLRHEDPDLTEDALLDLVDMRQMAEVSEKVAEAMGVAGLTAAAEKAGVPAPPVPLAPRYPARASVG